LMFAVVFYLLCSGGVWCWYETEVGDMFIGSIDLDAALIMASGCVSVFMYPACWQCTGAVQA
jgi:hypothetical protein